VVLDIVQASPYITTTTKVRMKQRFILWVTLGDTGDVHSVTAMDNGTYESIGGIDLYYAPEFVAERIALIKLTDVNKTEKGESVGRKLHEDVIIVYLTYDEYQQIKEECK
jgi:hypothetical protein